MRTDFDYKCTGHNTGTDIEYGFIKGSNEAIFIKSGFDGSLYGYENKYLDIADRLNLLYDYTVMVASNPHGSNDPLKEGMIFLCAFLRELGYSEAKLSYMGYSNGAYLGFTEGYKYNFSKSLLINAPLMINYHKIADGLSNSKGRDILIVYGERDPSAKFVGLLSGFLDDHIKLKLISGADHRFKGMTDEFKNIPIYYFGK